MVRAPFFFHFPLSFSPLMALDIDSTEPPGYTLLSPFCRRLCAHSIAISWPFSCTLVCMSIAYLSPVAQCHLPGLVMLFFCLLVCLRPYDAVCFVCGAYFFLILSWLFVWYPLFGILCLVIFCYCCCCGWHAVGRYFGKTKLAYLFVLFLLVHGWMTLFPPPFTNSGPCTNQNPCSHSCHFPFALARQAYMDPLF